MNSSSRHSSHAIHMATESVRFTSIRFQRQDRGRGPRRSRSIERGGATAERLSSGLSVSDDVQQREFLSPNRRPLLAMPCHAMPCRGFRSPSALNIIPLSQVINALPACLFARLPVYSIYPQPFGGGRGVRLHRESTLGLVGGAHG